MLVQAESWLDQEDDLLDMVKRWTIAFSRSMQVHLREDGDLEAELKVGVSTVLSGFDKFQYCLLSDGNLEAELQIRPERLL